MVFDSCERVVEPFCRRPAVFGCVVEQCFAEMPDRFVGADDLRPVAKYRTEKCRRCRTKVDHVDVVGTEFDGKVRAQPEGGIVLLRITGSEGLERNCNIDVAVLVTLAARTRPEHDSDRNGMVSKGRLDSVEPL